MKRIDDALDLTLVAMCRGTGKLSREQRQRNQRWVVKLRKQIDAARLRGAEK